MKYVLAAHSHIKPYKPLVDRFSPQGSLRKGAPRRFKRTCSSMICLCSGSGFKLTLLQKVNWCLDPVTTQLVAKIVAVSGAGKRAPAHTRSHLPPQPTSMEAIFSAKNLI